MVARPTWKFAHSCFNSACSTQRKSFQAFEVFTSTILETRRRNRRLEQRKKALETSRESVQKKERESPDAMAKKFYNVTQSPWNMVEEGAWWILSRCVVIFWLSCVQCLTEIFEHLYKVLWIYLLALYIYTYLCIFITTVTRYDYPVYLEKF